MRLKGAVGVGVGLGLLTVAGVSRFVSHRRRKHAERVAQKVREWSREFQEKVKATKFDFPSKEEM